MGFSLHCFKQVCMAIQLGLGRSHHLRFICPLTRVRSGITEVPLMLHTAHFYQVPTSPGVWSLVGSPSLRQTRLPAKPLQLINAELIYNNILRVLLINPFSHWAGMNQPFNPQKNHPSGRSRAYVVGSTSSSWRKSQAALPSSCLCLEQLSIAQPINHTGHRPFKVWGREQG